MKRTAIIISTLAIIAIPTFLLINGNNNTPTPDTPPASDQNQNTRPIARRIHARELDLLDERHTPYTLVDVRTEEEYTTEHIQGAVLLPSDKLRDLATSTLPDKTTKIIVYCQSGSRSRRATEELLRLGYTDVSDLGGIDRWEGATAAGATP